MSHCNHCKHSYHYNQRFDLGTRDCRPQILCEAPEYDGCTPIGKLYRVLSSLSMGAASELAITCHIGFLLQAEPIMARSRPHPADHVSHRPVPGTCAHCRVMKTVYWILMGTYCCSGPAICAAATWPAVCMQKPARCHLHIVMQMVMEMVQTVLAS